MKEIPVVANVSKNSLPCHESHESYRGPSVEERLWFISNIFDLFINY